MIIAQSLILLSPVSRLRVEADKRIYPKSDKKLGQKRMPDGEATVWHMALSVFGILSAEIFWRLFSGVPAESSPMCMRMRWA